MQVEVVEQTGALRVTVFLHQQRHILSGDIGGTWETTVKLSKETVLHGRTPLNTKKLKNSMIIGDDVSLWYVYYVETDIHFYI